MPDATADCPQPTRPVLSCGLAVLLLGLGYACPAELSPRNGAWIDSLPNEVRTLYALTAWLGMAHFAFAYRGQILTRPRPIYWLLLLAAFSGLAVLQHLLGWELFSTLAWIYFIAHFITTERRLAPPVGSMPRFAYYQVVVAFVWFNAALFDAGGLQHHPWWLFTGSMVLAAACLLGGAWRLLATDRARLPLLALILIAEALVWGTYGPNMSPGFRSGVYVFHIALASFYHYLSTWFYARQRAPADPWIRPAGTLSVLLACVAACWAVAHLPTLTTTRPWLGIEAFTLWVALHLVASDLFPTCRRKRPVPI